VPISAALLVVGNEVLSAKCADENGPHAIRRLRGLGVRLRTLAVLSDRMDDIVEAVDRERRRVTWVITSGGIGPTHDDVTVKAVARALSRPLVRNEALAGVVRDHHRERLGEDAPEAALRMADLPEGARLVGDPKFPTIAVENLFVLPGVPRFFRWQLEQIAPILAGTPLSLGALYLTLGENPIADVLEQVAARNPDVEIGSYPRFDDADHRVRVTVEGEDAGRVRAVLDALRAALPGGAVAREDEP
jgi:molybdenum cofactor synthesis domain-containing protein